MSTTQELRKYIKLLERHNWNYVFCDDHAEYKAGMAEWAVIDKEQKRIDTDWFLFNQYAPPEFRKKLSNA